MLALLWQLVVEMSYLEAFISLNRAMNLTWTKLRNTTLSLYELSKSFTSLSKTTNNYLCDNSGSTDNTTV